LLFLSMIGYSSAQATFVKIEGSASAGCGIGAKATTTVHFPIPTFVKIEGSASAGCGIGAKATTQVEL